MMEKGKTDSESFQESSNKKLEEIINKSKAENEALKKILLGLEKLEKEIYKQKKDKNNSNNK